VKKGLSDWFDHEPELMPGAIEFLHKIEKESAVIILVTARKESTRRILMEQLSQAGVFYDLLIMGATNGERVMINDGQSSLMTGFPQVPDPQAPVMSDEVCLLSDTKDIVSMLGYPNYVTNMSGDVTVQGVTFLHRDMMMMTKREAYEFIKDSLCKG
jgi:hypothetical protein